MRTSAVFFISVLARRLRAQREKSHASCRLKVKQPSPDEAKVKSYYTFSERPVTRLSANSLLLYKKNSGANHRRSRGGQNPIWKTTGPASSRRARGRDLLLAPGTHARRHTQYLREAVCLVQHVEEDEDRVLRDTRSFTRSLRLTGLRASLSSNSIRADGSTAGAGSRSSASAGSASRSRASSESRSRETSEHAAVPPYPSPASLSRSI